MASPTPLASRIAAAHVVHPGSRVLCTSLQGIPGAPMHALQAHAAGAPGCLAACLVSCSLYHAGSSPYVCVFPGLRSVVQELVLPCVEGGFVQRPALAAQCTTQLLCGCDAFCLQHTPHKSTGRQTVMCCHTSSVCYSLTKSRLLQSKLRGGSCVVSAWCEFSCHT